MRRETSAAFVVRYLSVTPLEGSYVLRTRLPRGVFGFVDSGEGSDLAGLMEYFVVIRVFRGVWSVL